MIKENNTEYGDQLINVTVSVGCDSLPESSISGELDLVANADEALYRAKNSGRDKCVIH
jgi:diguanylate cyclase (GGDEF)-like protein